MNRHTQTYSWILLLAFMLGGVVAPTLHFTQHLTNGDHHPTADEVVVTTASSADYIDCSLCDAKLVGTSVTTCVQATVVGIETVHQRAPQRLALDLIGNASNRGPPAPTLG